MKSVVAGQRVRVSREQCRDLGADSRIEVVLGD
jgi:hypothetical protein